MPRDHHIPPHLLDIDLQAAAAAIGRYTGLRPRRPEAFGAVCPIFEERYRERLIPRSQWAEALGDDGRTENRAAKTWQYDQRNEGTCTANACSGGMSYTWTKQFGRALAIAPAPISLYKFCARGPNSGSTTSCILARARDHGALLIDTPSNRAILQAMGLDPAHVLRAVGYSQRFPSGWEQTAQHFKLEEFYEISSPEGFFTALLLGYSVLYGRAGHAIHGVDVVHDRGKFVCAYDNSWGQWGDDGFGYDSFDYIRRTNAPWGAYAILTTAATPATTALLQAPQPLNERNQPTMLA